MPSAKIVKIDPQNPDEKYLNEAASVLAKGGLVIIPTETVYGIAADKDNAKAVDRLYEIKKRPHDKPFTVHIDSKDKIETLVNGFPPAAYRLIEKFWPGPLTLVGKALKGSTVGLRLPDCQVAREIIARSGVSVVCPSANISGKPAPATFEEAIKDLKGLVDYALDAGPTSRAKESTVVDVTAKPPRVIREGAITKDQIEAVAGKKTVLFVCTGNSCRSVMAKGLLEKKMKEKGRRDVEVISAGIIMMGGLGASEETRELLAQEGIDVSGHRSQRITKDMLDKADLIVVMEKNHEQRILEIDPGVRKRLFLLKEFAASKDVDLDIIDPMGKTDEFYRDTFLTIKQAVEKIGNIL